MSRERDDDIEFGSDSFLDVVANIVGILIILIVVAGIKAGAAPVAAARVVDYLRKHPATASVAAAVKAAAPAPAKPPSPAAPVSRPPLIIPQSPDLVRKAQVLKAEFAALESDCQTSAAQIGTTASEEKETARRITKLKRAIQEESGELKQEHQQLTEAASRLEHEKTGLLQLEVDVQKAEAKKPPVQTLEHKLTPLSRMIQGKELHYQLLNNRVAYLPIQELMERMRPEIAEQRSRLYREGVQQGQVGPVAGFRMDYIVRSRRLSTIDELRQGSSSTIALSQWRLVPEPDLDTEGVDEALKAGSDFLRFLRGADADTTITFWVYPDSFKIYRRLQEFAHHENFTVAARPLPMGVPIAGSPQGTRSAGQ
ncbi:MAG TPA: hypothetical protein VMR25_24665 [Planctomycetaceae bacterium]|nr:hypothetical protein [Planctomycetaceae bacterium]